MKKFLINLFAVLFLTAASAETAYKISDKDVNYNQFPKIELKLWSRSFHSLDTGNIGMKENDSILSNVSYKTLNSDSFKALNKILFILIENHYLAKGAAERSFFKKVLTGALNGHIKRGDKIYIGTFDWYRNNKYVFIKNETPSDNAYELSGIINSINSPASLSNEQKGADIYFALDEALKFVSKLKDSLPKNILLLSDDYPNIAGQKTVEEIRELSLKSGIPIYAIGYNVGGDRYSLVTEKEICEPTNGEYFSSSTNNIAICTERVGAFLDNMNANSFGKTYLVSYTTKQKKLGQKVNLAILVNGKSADIAKIKYPFNLLNWIARHVLLTLAFGLVFVLFIFGAFLLNKGRQKAKNKKHIEEQEKQLQFRNTETEIFRLKQQQQVSEKRLYDQKNKIEEQARLEKQKQLLKAKGLMPRITYEYNGQKGHFFVDSPKFTLGRDKDSNSFHMSVPSISRNHAEIIFDEIGQFIIKDLNSTNGVIVNGHKMSETALKNGDTIKLGDVFLKVNL
jgi:hypothetical protein